MYFENGRISPRQMTRLIITEFLGITLLSSTGITSGMCGRDGILSIVYATVFAAVSVWLVLILCEKTGGSVLEYLEAHFGRKVSCAVAAIFGIKYLIFAVGVLLLLGTVVQRILLQQFHPAIVIIPMLLLFVYGLSLDWEARARFAEVAYYFVLIPAIIVVLITWNKCDRYNIAPLFMVNHGRVLISGLWYMLLSAPAEMLLFSRQHFDADTKMKRAVLKGVFILGIFNVIYFILNVGIYGIESALDRQISSLMLMQAVGHIESIMSLFLIISLYTLLNCYGSYSIEMIRHLVKGKNNKFNRVWYMYVVGAVIGLVSCTASAYGVLAGPADDVSAGVTMEEKDYIMFMGIDYDGGQYTVTYGLDNDRESIVWKGSTLLEAREQYAYISPGTVDFSHIKAIVLGEELVKSGNGLEDLGRFLESDETIANDTLVVSVEGKAEKYDELKGSSIKDMFDNNLSYLKCDAYEMVQAVSDRYKAAALGIITKKEDYPECTGALILDGRGKVKKLGVNESKILMLTDRDVAGNTFTAADRKVYKIVQNQPDIQINIINNETIGVDVTLRGTLKNIAGYSVEKDTANEKIELEVFNILTDLMCNSSIDYLNVYNRLSVADKGMWVKYSTDRKSMYKRVYFNVNADYDFK